MKTRGVVTRLLYDNDGYKVYGFKPLDRKIETNKYGTITIKGNIPDLIIDKEYTFVLEKDNNPKYKDSYNITIDAEDLEINEDEARNFIKEITSGYLVDSIYSAYPDFATLILEGREDEIDLKKIKGVKEKRFEVLKEKIKDKFKYYQVILKFPQYKFNLKEAKSMFKKEPKTSKLYESISNNPYYWLIDECGRGFEKSDTIICQDNEKWLTSEIRIEYCMLFVLNMNEYNKNTYMDANEMANYCREYTPECFNLIKEVAMKSSLIYYDEATKRIAKSSTYLCECYIANKIKDMVKKENQVEIDYTKYYEFDGFKLTEEQEKLLEYALKYNVTILTAGAGNGKSFTVSALTKMLEDNRMTYTLLAPTGKASKVLSEYTKRPCYTIHRRLGVQKDFTSSSTIESNYCILDEASMVGIGLMKVVLESLSKDTKLILVCDPYQLSSLSVGNVVSDLINSNIVPIVRLTKTMRFSGGIYMVSDYARQGIDFIEEDYFTLGDDEGYKYIKPTNYFDDVLEEYQKLLDNGISSKDIIVLTPHNVNQLGTYNFNNAIQDLVNPVTPNCKQLSYKRDKYEITFRVGDRVMNTVNTYNIKTLEGFKENIEDIDEESDSKLYTNVFNGEEGIVRSIDEEKKVIVCQFDEEMIVFEGDYIKQLVLGYAINHFKAQGSSSPYVICVESPIHSKTLNRNCYYVGLTRAKKQVIDIGDKNTIEKALKIVDNEERKTFLKDLLIEG